MNTCMTQSNGARRTFWTTQPDACGEQSSCGVGCGRAGLRFITNPSCAPSCCCGENPNVQAPCSSNSCTKARTIANNDWLRSLAINILMTDQRREDNVCGYAPHNINGHYSDSFTGGSKVGTDLRYMKTNLTTSKMLAEVKARATNSLSKMIKYGVASSVSVTAKYINDGIIRLEASIVGMSGTTSNVGVQGQRNNSYWVWS